MKLNYFFLVIFLGMYSVSNAQNQKEVINLLLKKNGNYSFNETDTLINKIENDTLKRLFIEEQIYYVEGKKVIPNNMSLSLKNSSLKNALIYFFEAKKQIRQQTKSKIAYTYFNKALAIAERLNDLILKKEILFELMQYLEKFSRNEIGTYILRKNYLKEYHSSVRDSLDYYRKYLITLGIEMQQMESDSAFYENKNIENILENIKRYAGKNLYFKGNYHRWKGIYLEVFKQDYSSSYESFLRAKNYYNKLPYYYAQKEIPALDNSIGILLFRQKKYRKALKIFEPLLEETTIKKKAMNLMYVNEWIYKCYEGLKNYEKAYFYFSQYKSIYDNLNKEKHIRSILEIEKDNNLQKKEKELEKLKKENHFLGVSLYTLIPILFGIILILILIYRLYKRYQKKSTVLEEEQSETIQKLDELKQIVIKNHIVLKDKTKVYITDLMYIQSDDHYLKVFTQDGKNRFVRGKLSQLKEELPPNFIQCHRSYIVNRNFIKQIHSKTIVLINKEEIPLSRTYKNTL